MKGAAAQALIEIGLIVSMLGAIAIVAAAVVVLS